MENLSHGQPVFACIENIRKYLINLTFHCFTFEIY